MRISYLIALLFGLWLALNAEASPPVQAAANPSLRIGVLAYRGAAQARAEWQPHADYLNRVLAPYKFVVVPLTLGEFEPAIAAGRIDFVITNTGSYVGLEAGGNISRIATMRIAGPNGPVDRFGGVAFARADRTDLRGYADLRGKRVAIPDRTAFAGWQVHLPEARAVGIDLATDLGGIVELQSQEKIVAEVLSGRADVGFVRSDLLESLAAAGKIDIGQVRIIGERQTPGYPYRHSTRLYPHWPFAKAAHVSEELARDILIALLRLPPDHPATKAAAIHGWTLPQNYQSVHELFIEYRLGPYAQLPVTARDIMGRYGKAIIGGAVAIILALLAALWAVATANRTLRRNRGRLQLAAGVFDHAQEGIVITDAQANIIDANGTFLALTGYSRDEVIGRNPRFLAAGNNDPAFYREMWKSLGETGSWRGELLNRRKDGTPYVQQTSISAVHDEAGRVTRYIGLSSDVTELRESRERLNQMAYFDALTALPNRRLLSDRLNQAIAFSQRAETLLAIAYLDLDGFKPINDTWGHAAGDTLLIEAANRLLSSVRAGDTVSRLGGDEFVLLLGNLTNFDECEIVLDRVRTALTRPFTLSQGEASLSASIGVTLFPLDSVDPDTLLRHADQAMYAAKQAGRNRYSVYDAAQDRILEARHATQQSIRAAIANEELRLHFQPKVNMRTGAIAGAEALVRWQHPERGLLFPNEFLPAVEFVGLLGELGDWVLRDALRQLDAWKRQGLTLVLSVNVAADQFQSPDFVGKLGNVLAMHPTLGASCLELEILETAALQDLAQVSEVMRACRALGISFAIDDFGTGYSSLTYLKRLQAETLKVDQSFVRDMLNDPDALAIVDGIIGLATSFRRQVLAEGVESVRHGQMLLQLGCELAQGYGIARPMGAEDFFTWCSDWKQPDEWREIVAWPRADLPLLTIEIDHVRWVDEFRVAIEKPDGVPVDVPPLDPHACRFGAWLDTAGRGRYGTLSGFADLNRLHETIHARGKEIEEIAQRDRGAARARMSDLEADRDHLLAALARFRAEALELRD